MKRQCEQIAAFKPDLVVTEKARHRGRRAEGGGCRGRRRARPPARAPPASRQAPHADPPPLSPSQLQPFRACPTWPSTFCPKPRSRPSAVSARRTITASPGPRGPPSCTGERGRGSDEWGGLRWVAGRGKGARVWTRGTPEAAPPTRIPAPAPGHSSTDEIRESDIGTGAGLFEVIKVGDEFYACVVDCDDPKACTIVLRGASKDVLNEVERNLQDAMGVARNVVLNPRLVPGGGAGEAAAAAALADAAAAVAGPEAGPMRAFGTVRQCVFGWGLGVVWGGGTPGRPCEGREGRVHSRPPRGCARRLRPTRPALRFLERHPSLASPGLPLGVLAACRISAKPAPPPHTPRPSPHPHTPRPPPHPFRRSRSSRARSPKTAAPTSFAP